MKVLGIDLAASDKKTYACVLEGTSGALVATLYGSCDDDCLRELAQGQAKVAIDAPFGWPSGFVDALIAHRTNKPWPAPAEERPEAFRESLRFRATDRVTMQTRQPLSVSTDRIGVTAMRCALLLHRWSQDKPIDRTGAGRFVEVYPAGALRRWGLDPSGYKGTDSKPLGKLLNDVCAALPALQLTAADRRTCATNDDAFDALVAALVARAAWLRLTEGPPATLKQLAAEEGWIHLPVRGSLPLLAASKTALAAKPEAALAQRLRDAGVKLDAKGYATRADDVLLPAFPARTRATIVENVRRGRGSELAARAGGRPKFHAAHSSAAFAANAFGPFLDRGDPVPFDGQLFEGAAQLEVPCPTELRGTPPTLDVLVDGAKILAVESKCTETFSRHSATFEPSYRTLTASMHTSWRAEYERLVEDPTRYRHLDAAQLVKHYLGLRRQYPNRAVTFAYLYWTPVNAEEVAACAIHAAEVAEFGRRVADPELTFTAMSYGKLAQQWSAREQPAWLRRHVAALRGRYDVVVGSQ